MNIEEEQQQSQLSSQNKNKFTQQIIELFDFSAPKKAEEEKSFQHLESEQDMTDVDIQIPKGEESQPLSFVHSKLKILKCSYEQKWKAKNIIAISALFLCVILYSFNLKDYCYEEQFPTLAPCIQFLEQSLPGNFKIVFFCAIVHIVIQYQSFISKSIHKLNGILSVIIFIYQTTIQYGTADIDAMNLRNYRPGIVLILLTIYFLFFGIILLIRGIYKLYKKTKKTLYVLGSIFLILSLMLSVSMYKSCNGWETGLVGEIEQDDVLCHVKRPSVCWPVIVDNVLNLSKWSNCDIDMHNQEQRDYLLKKSLENYKISDKIKDTDMQLSDVKYIGWPKFQPLPDQQRVKEDEILVYTIDESKVYDKTNNLEEVFEKGNHEVVIDIEEQEINVKVQRDPEIVEKRQKQAQNFDSLSKNIIFVYIDTVSRAHFYRKLKKSAEFLRKYAQNQVSGSNEEDPEAFEFFRYHSLENRTFGNVLRFQYDIYQHEFDLGIRDISTENKQRSLFHDIQDAGYITGHTTNTLSINSCTRDREFKDLKLIEYFENVRFDHEFYFFDPQYMQAGNSFALKQGMNSIFRRCAYGHDTNKYVFDYGIEFLETYKDEKKFLLLEFTDGHEVTSEVIQYLDDNLYNFLTGIEEKGHLKKDTILYLASDHGQHQQNLFFFTASRKNVMAIEKVLPFYFMVVSKDILEKSQEMQENIVENQQHLISIYEIRNSLLVNAYGLKNNTDIQQQRFQQSSFGKLGLDRDCLDLGLIRNPGSIQEQYCSCVPQDTTFVEKWKSVEQDRFDQAVKRIEEKIGK